MSAADSAGSSEGPIDTLHSDNSPRPAGGRPVLESVLVLAVSLGASAVWSLLAIVDKLTKQLPLSQQTTTMNNSVTPDRPWLDLTYQLVGVVLGVMPALLAYHLVRREVASGGGLPMGLTGLRSPRTWLADLAKGAALAALVGIPGLGLYLAARAGGVNTTIAAANLADQWWTLPVLVLAAMQNAVLEEVVMVGYLFRRWGQAGWSFAAILLTSAVVRGSYHLYQGFGGFVGNIAMGLIFGLAYRRWRRVGPLVVAHTLLDVVAFVGYSLLRGHVSWL